MNLLRNFVVVVPMVGCDLKPRPCRMTIDLQGFTGVKLLSRAPRTASGLTWHTRSCCSVLNRRSPGQSQVLKLQRRLGGRGRGGADAGEISTAASEPQTRCHEGHRKSEPDAAASSKEGERLVRRSPVHPAAGWIGCGSLRHGWFFSAGSCCCGRACCREPERRKAGNRDDPRLECMVPWDADTGVTLVTPCIAETFGMWRAGHEGTQHDRIVG